MKNISSSSWETDRRALLPAALVAAIAIPLLFDLLPNPTGAFTGKVLSSAISFGLAICVWAAFRLLEPTHLSHRWAVAEWICIPPLWSLILWGVTSWLQQDQASYL